MCCVILLWNLLSTLGCKELFMTSDDRKHHVVVTHAYSESCYNMLLYPSRPSGSNKCRNKQNRHNKYKVEGGASVRRTCSESVTNVRDKNQRCENRHKHNNRSKRSGQVSQSSSKGSIESVETNQTQKFDMDI